MGISKAHDREELKAAIEEALKIDKRVLIEETVIGRELEARLLLLCLPAILAISVPAILPA